MTKKEYITHILKYVCEIEDITRLNRIFNYVSKEYVKDSGSTDDKNDSAEWIRYKALLDAVNKVEDSGKLELIERFARRLLGQSEGGREDGNAE